MKENLESTSVSITGGLGNELFQLENGNSVPWRSDSRVELVCQKFAGATARSFQLDFARNIPGGEVMPKKKPGCEVYVQARWVYSKEVSALMPHTDL